MYLIFLLLALLKVIHTEDSHIIFLDDFSRDVAECGTEEKPCRSIKYAVDTYCTQEYITEIIGNGSSFNEQSINIKDKKVHFIPKSSYNITIAIVSSQQNESSLFEIESGYLSIENVTLNSPLSTKTFQLIILGQQGSLILSNCTIKTNNANRVFDLSIIDLKGGVTTFTDVMFQQFKLNSYALIQVSELVQILTLEQCSFAQTNRKVGNGAAIEATIRSGSVIELIGVSFKNCEVINGNGGALSINMLTGSSFYIRDSIGQSEPLNIHSEFQNCVASADVISPGQSLGQGGSIFINCISSSQRDINSNQVEFDINLTNVNVYNNRAIVGQDLYIIAQDLDSVATHDRFNIIYDNETEGQPLGSIVGHSDYYLVGEYDLKDLWEITPPHVGMNIIINGSTDQQSGEQQGRDHPWCGKTEQYGCSTLPYAVELSGGVASKIYIIQQTNIYKQTNISGIYVFPIQLKPQPRLNYNKHISNQDSDILIDIYLKENQQQLTSQPSRSLLFTIGDTLLHNLRFNLPNILPAQHSALIELYQGNISIILCQFIGETQTKNISPLIVPNQGFNEVKVLNYALFRQLYGDSLISNCSLTDASFEDRYESTGETLSSGPFLINLRYDSQQQPSSFKAENTSFERITLLRSRIFSLELSQDEDYLSVETQTTFPSFSLTNCIFNDIIKPSIRRACLISTIHTDMLTSNKNKILTINSPRILLSNCSITKCGSGTEDYTMNEGQKSILVTIEGCYIELSQSTFSNIISGNQIQTNLSNKQICLWGWDKEQYISASPDDITVDFLFINCDTLFYSIKVEQSEDSGIGIVGGQYHIIDATFSMIGQPPQSSDEHESLRQLFPSARKNIWCRNGSIILDSVIVDGQQDSLWFDIDGCQLIGELGEKMNTNSLFKPSLQNVVYIDPQSDNQSMINNIIAYKSINKDEEQPDNYTFEITGKNFFPCGLKIVYLTIHDKTRPADISDPHDIQVINEGLAYFTINTLDELKQLGKKWAIALVYGQEFKEMSEAFFPGNLPKDIWKDQLKAWQITLIIIGTLIIIALLIVAIALGMYYHIKNKRKNQTPARSLKRRWRRARAEADIMAPVTSAEGDYKIANESTKQP